MLYFFLYMPSMPTRLSVFSRTVRTDLADRIASGPVCSSAWNKQRKIVARLGFYNDISKRNLGLRVKKRTTVANTLMSCKIQTTVAAARRLAVGQWDFVQFCIYELTFFLLNAEGTNLYASFLSILVIYLVAIRSPQFGQNMAP